MTVVVGYDASPAAQRALLWAAGLVGRTGQRLEVVHAVDLGVVPAPRLYDLPPLVPSLEGVVDSLTGGPSVLPRAALPRDRVRGRHAFGHPAGVLVDAALTSDLVVVGSRGRGRLASGLIGSTSLAVVAHAAAPVVIVHDPPRGRAHPGHRLVAPGPTAEVVCGVVPHVEPGPRWATTIRTVRAAGALAAACRAPLRLVSVLPESGRPVAGSPPCPEPVAGLADVVAEHPDLEVRTVAREGEVSTALTAEADSAQAAVLVIGAPRQGGVRGVLAWSTSHRVVEGAGCPVMLVP